MSNGIKSTQEWQFDTVDTRTGIITHSEKRKNVITNAGISAIMSRIIGNNDGHFYSHVAIGTGSRRETAADTSLQAQVRKAAVSDATAFADSHRIVARFSYDPDEGDQQIREGGILDADDNLLARVTTVSPAPLEAGRAVTITITASLAQA